MAALQQALDMKQALNKVAEAKKDAHRERMGLAPVRPMYENIWNSCIGKIRNTFLLTFCPCTIYDPGRHLRKRRFPKTFCGRVWHDGTYENQVLKSAFGFIGGIALSLLWLSLMVFYMKYSYLTSTITCGIMSLVLSIGLAFSDTTRCLTLLSLPGLFSSKGRAVLVAVCFVLALNGPLQNFRYNVHVLSGTVTCGQQMATNITKEVVDSALAPVKDIMGSIRSVLLSLTQLAEELRDAVLKIRDLFVEVKNLVYSEFPVQAVKRVFSWLGSMVNVCNKKMGAPHAKCTNAFNAALHDCRIKLGIMKFMCEVVHTVTWVCEVTRVGEILCQIPATIKQQITDELTSGIRFALKDVYDMFYFKVNLTYHYDIRLEQSKTYEEVREDIQDEIEARIQPLLNVSGLSNGGLLLMMTLLVFKGYQYRRKFLTKDRHDNCYVSWHLRDIDTKREETDQETILPLNWNEKSKYISTFTPRLAKHERRRLIIGLVFLGASGIHLGFQLACDAGLYWLLSMIREVGELRTTASAPGQVKMHVQGEGVLPDIYRAMITEFDPMSSSDSLSIDTTPCLPIPSRPDFSIYIRIGYIFATCVLLQLTQSYGLRLRHIVAACYHPEREKVRAVWLYNHILKRRGSFVTELRRRVHAKSKTEKSEALSGLLDLTAAKCKLLGKVLRMVGLAKLVYCLACSKSGKPNNKTDFVHCDNRRCKAVYCNECYGDLNNLCTACMNPVDYGDFSDISEERDSSDENVRRRATRRLREGRYGNTSSSSTSTSSSPSSSSTEYDYQYHKDLDDPASSSTSSEDEAKRELRRRTLSRLKPLETVSLEIFSGPAGQSRVPGDSSEEEGSRTGEVKPLLRV